MIVGHIPEFGDERDRILAAIDPEFYTVTRKAFLGSTPSRVVEILEDLCDSEWLPALRAAIAKSKPFAEEN